MNNVPVTYIRRCTVACKGSSPFATVQWGSNILEGAFPVVEWPVSDLLLVNGSAKPLTDYTTAKTEGSCKVQHVPSSRAAEHVLVTDVLTGAEIRVGAAYVNARYPANSAQWLGKVSGLCGFSNNTAGTTFRNAAGTVYTVAPNTYPAAGSRYNGGNVVVWGGDWAVQTRNASDYYRKIYDSAASPVAPTLPSPAQQAIIDQTAVVAPNVTDASVAAYCTKLTEGHGPRVYENCVYDYGLTGKKEFAQSVVAARETAGETAMMHDCSSSMGLTLSTQAFWCPARARTTFPSQKRCVTCCASSSRVTRMHARTQAWVGIAAASLVVGALIGGVAGARLGARAAQKRMSTSHDRELASVGVVLPHPPLDAPGGPPPPEEKISGWWRDFTDAIGLTHPDPAPKKEEGCGCGSPGNKTEVNVRKSTRFS